QPWASMARVRPGQPQGVLHDVPPSVPHWRSSRRCSSPFPPRPSGPTAQSSVVENTDMGIVKDLLGNYVLTGKSATEFEVLAAAEDILRGKRERMGSIGSPRDSADFLRMRLG